MDIFDELLDDVVEEFGSKKDEQTKVKTDSEVKDEVKEVRNDSAQSKGIRQVEVSRKNDRTANSTNQTPDSSTQSRTTNVLGQHTGRVVSECVRDADIRTTRQEDTGNGSTTTTDISEAGQNKVWVSEGNAKDEMDKRKDGGVETDVAWLPVGEMPTRTKTGRLNLTNVREKDKNRNKRSGLFGSKPIEFAGDSEAAKMTFKSTTLRKPRWAVFGCVLLRDQGICQVCGERLRREFKVVQIIPPSSGKGFTEDNCISVCEECVICWKPAYKINIYNEGSNKYGKLKHRLSILTRRLKGYHGCRTLSETGLVVRRSLLAQKERMELELDDERKKVIKAAKSI